MATATHSAASVDPSISRAPIPLNARDLANVCVLCSHNCGVRVDVADGRITAVRADETGLTEGYICNKGASIPLTVEHAQRLAYPLRRRADGSFERVSWATAIAEIAAKLWKIRAEHGGNAIGLIGGGGQGNHLGGAYGLALTAALGSRRWYSSYAQEKSQHHLIDQWMFDAPPSTSLQPDEENAPLLIALGTNPRVSNRGPKPNITFNDLRRDRKRKLIVIDPRITETTAGADLHLRLKPATDVFLLLAIARTLIEEDRVDRAFIAERTVGFERVQAALAAVRVGEMAGRCGLREDEIRGAARAIAGAQAASIMYDLSVEQTWFSTLNSYLIKLILALTGNIARPGANFFREGFSPPARSRNRFREPERSVVAGVPAIRALGNFAMTSPNVVPEEILTDDPRRLRAVLVDNSNPWLAYADTPRWREARKKLELMVVVEVAMTETAVEADYVLPAPVGYEKWEWAGFAKGGFPKIGTQLRPPVVPPPGEALPEPEIYARLAEALDLFGEPPADLYDLAESALEPDGIGPYAERLGRAAKERAGRAAGPCSLFWAYRTLGPHLPGPGPAALLLRCIDNGRQRPAAVVRALGAEWQDAGAARLGLEMFRLMLAHPEGVVIAVADRAANFEANVGWEDKRVRLLPEPMTAEIERALAFKAPLTKEFPLLLAAGLRTHWTANAIHRDPAWRKGKSPHCALHLHPDDAAAAGIADGGRATLRTARGALELPAEIDRKVLPGHVWAPNGFGAVYPDAATGELVMQGVNLNEITDALDRDPISGCPHHKAVPCRVEACPPAPAAKR